MRQTLRPYQLRALDGIRAEYRAGAKRVLLVLPTGGGKTTVAAEMIHSAVARGRRVTFIAHRKELIDQASARLGQFGVEHGVIMADHPNWRPWLPVQVASIQTLRARRDSTEIQPPDLVVIDESHRAKADTYLGQLAQWPEAHVIGLTATPWRADGKGLGDLFEASVVASTPSELTEMGFLVRADGFGFESADLSAVHVRGGDYDELELAEAMNVTKINGAIVEEWKRHANGWLTVCFAVNIEHSKAIVEQFRQAGVKAEHLDGSMKKADREGILARLASGETTVVSNVGVLTEGWDCPQTACCILARPTKSVGLYLQMAGRVLRPHPSKTHARIHDHAGCLVQHGPPDEDRDYSLTADLRRQRKKESGGEAVVNCPQCLRVCRVLDVRCPACGFQFEQRHTPGGERGKVKTVEGGLVTLEEIRRRRQAELHERPVEERAAEYKRLLAVAERKGYAAGWAAHKYRSTFGVWPRFPKGLLEDVEPARSPILPLNELRQLAEAAHA